MSTVALVEATVKPDSVRAFQAMMDDALDDTRAFEGCNSVKLLQDQDNPASFVLYEVWESREHHEKYLSWREKTGFLDSLGTLLASAPSIRYFEIANDGS